MHRRRHFNYTERPVGEKDHFTHSAVIVAAFFATPPGVAVSSKHALSLLP
jgi:hypothetical protein